MAEPASQGPSKALAPLSTTRNFSWTLVGNVVYAACQWGMLVALAKLGSPEAVGMFALGLAITAPVVLFFNLHLRALQATDTRDQHRFADYLGLRLTALVGVLLVTVLVLAGAGFAWKTAAVVLLVGLAKVVEAVSDVFHGLFHRHERLDKVGRSLVIKGVLSLSAFSAAMALTREVWIAVVALGVARLVVLLTFDRHHARVLQQGHDVHPAFDYAKMRELALLGLPGGMYAVLWGLNTNIPRYFLEGHAGTEALGIFAALSYLLVAGTTVTSALGQAFTPRLARLHQGQEGREWGRLLAALAALGLALGLAGIGVAAWFGEWLLTILYTTEYAAHADTLVVLMFAGTLTYMASFLGFGITSTRRLGPLVPLAVAVSLATVAGSAVLVPWWGLEGAAWTLVLSGSIHFLGCAWIVVRALWSLPTSDTEFR